MHGHPSTYAGIALMFAAFACLISVATLMRAQTRKKSTQILAGVVTTLHPTDFGAQNLDLHAERNGLRRHTVSLAGTDGSVEVLSYSWRDAGTRVQVIGNQSNGYMFASDLYQAPMWWAILAIAGMIAATLLWLGPFA